MTCLAWLWIVATNAVPASERVEAKDKGLTEFLLKAWAAATENRIEKLLKTNARANIIVASSKEHQLNRFFLEKHGSTFSEIDLSGRHTRIVSNPDSMGRPEIPRILPNSDSRAFIQKMEEIRQQALVIVAKLRAAALHSCRNQIPH